jgi:hypothetical protein
MRELRDDLRLAARRLRQRPGFTVVALLTLALGIGANTAIFTLVHAAMLQTLPITRPHELVRRATTTTAASTEDGKRRRQMLSWRALWRDALAGVHGLACELAAEG